MISAAFVAYEIVLGENPDVGDLDDVIGAAVNDLAAKDILRNNLVTFSGALPVRGYCVVPFSMKVMRKHIDGGELHI
jgi:hypothetical protein